MGHLSDAATEAHCSARVWSAACEMLEFFRCTVAYRRSLWALEIGAGTGWLGLALARRLPWQLRLSDMELALPRLHANADINAQARLGSVEVVLGDWADPDGMMDDDLDLVFGSDLVYNSATVALLPNVFKVALTSGAEVLYAHTLHRWGGSGYDAPLFAACSSAGLQMRPIWMASAGAIDIGHKALQQHLCADRYKVHPEQRPVVFQISFGEPCAAGEALLTLSCRVQKQFWDRIEESHPDEVDEIWASGKLTDLFEQVDDA